MNMTICLIAVFYPALTIEQNVLGHAQSVVT
jgi:hypothetical protein